MAPEEYARLEPLARAQPSHHVTRADAPVASYPLVNYVYSFRPGFDPSGITRLEILPFSGAPGKAAEVAAELPGALARRLNANGLPASAVPAATPGAYILSGAVTRTGDPGPETNPETVGIQVEATIARGGATVGSMQVNALGTSGFGGLPLTRTLGLLIASAIEGSRAQIASRYMAEILQRARAGVRQGTSVNSDWGQMRTPAARAEAR